MRRVDDRNSHERRLFVYLGAVIHQGARRLCVFLALASAMAAPASRAERPAGHDERGPDRDPVLGIGGKSACPRPEAVWAALETLIPREQLEGQAPIISPSSSSTVEILDLGPRYRVIAGGRVREYRDDAHDCQHRARVAAVFVALSLAPAYFGQPVPPTAAVPPTTISPSSPSETPVRRSVHLNVGASYLAGLSGDRHAAPALTLRLAVRRPVWGLVAGVTVPLPTDAEVNGLRLREFRAPADLGVRAALLQRRIELDGEVGLTAAWLSERALDLATSTPRSTWEWGTRVALTLRLSPSSVIAPFVTAHVELVPRPATLWAIPQGQVGHSPLLWAGLTAGASLGL